MAAVVEAISKSERRALLDCPAALAAANTLPYIRAASASKGSGSQVAVAHCNRSSRLARSSLFSVHVVPRRARPASLL